MLEYTHFVELNLLAETVNTDLRTKDFQDDFQGYVQLNYQSLYLHLKALSQLYLMKGDVNTSRRLMNFASQLATTLNQQQTFQFRK